VKIIDNDGPVHATAFDRASATIYFLEADETDGVCCYRTIDIATGAVGRVPGLQQMKIRHGFTFSSDFRSAWWGEDSGMIYRFGLEEARKDFIWKLPDGEEAPIRAMLVAASETVAVVTMASTPDRLRTYLLDLETGTGKLLIMPNRHRGLIVRGWTPDSRYIYLEPECDGGCEPYHSQPGRYYIYDLARRQLDLFYRARKFDDRGAPIDGMRFVAWLRDG
jgi:hypothetical protein